LVIGMIGRRLNLVGLIFIRGYAALFENLGGESRLMNQFILRILPLQETSKQVMSSCQLPNVKIY
jgi:hypothetical protein